MISKLAEVTDFISSLDGTNDKTKVTQLVVDRFGLVQDRRIYYCDDFAIRFSSSNSSRFSNTVLSLSNLQKYDLRPFLVCLVTPISNHIFLANTSFLKKISHSSQQLRENNIRGSFNGSDIMRSLETIDNIPSNFERLFLIHEGLEFEDNLKRLVESTNNISPSGHRFQVSAPNQIAIETAPNRAAEFIASRDFVLLKSELDDSVDRFKSEIIVASLIENPNVRGRIIEYLIAGEDEVLKSEIIAAIKNKGHGIPPFKTENALGDYSKNFEKYLTETDVKTKIMFLNSNPKAYNIDKMLEFLSTERSVFMFYFVGIDVDQVVNTVLVSMFQDRLMGATITLRHWAGRNSRGVTQLDGTAIKHLITNPESNITINEAKTFLKRLIEL